MSISPRNGRILVLGLVLAAVLVIGVVEWRRASRPAPAVPPWELPAASRTKPVVSENTSTSSPTEEERMLPENFGPVTEIYVNDQFGFSLEHPSDILITTETGAAMPIPGS